MYGNFKGLQLFVLFRLMSYAHIFLEQNGILSTCPMPLSRFPSRTIGSERYQPFEFTLVCASVCISVFLAPAAVAAVSLLDTSTDSYGADDFGSDQDPEPEAEAEAEHGNDSGRFEEEEVIDEEVIDEEVEESFDVDAGDDDDDNGSNGYSSSHNGGRVAAANAFSAQSRQQQHVRLWHCMYPIICA